MATQRRLTKRPDLDDEMSAHERDLMDAAEEAERHMDEPLGPAVAAIVTKGARDVFSLKVGADELDELADAAEAAGVSVGAFIREAALQKARGQQGAALKRVRKQVRELAESVKSL
jgi:hypothetical protein